MDIDYTIRVLSEDSEVMNEETVITDDENDAQIVFLETVENMEDVYRRTKQFGPITVQCSTRSHSRSSGKYASTVSIACILTD